MEKERYEKKGNRGRSKPRKADWRGKSRERNGKCFICKKPDHWKNECLEKEKVRKDVSSSSVAVESGVSDGDVVVLTVIALNVSNDE